MITRHFQTKINHRVVEHAGVLYFGGLTATDTSQDMKAQTQEICTKIDELLEQVGSSKDRLLTAMIYLSDFSQKDAMNEAWLEWLQGEHLPTRATIGVADLGENTLIEVVVTAAR